MIISNLDERVDNTLLKEDNVNCWHAIPYETDEFSGVMLGQGLGESPLELIIDLDIEGVYDIYLGMFSHRYHGSLRCRLSREKYFKRLAMPAFEQRFSEPVLTEVFFKNAEISNQKLIVQSAFGTDEWRTYPTALTHIRLVRVKHNTKRIPDKFHKMALTNDGFGIFQECPHSRPEDLLESFENISDDSCMKILLWGTGNAFMSNYPSKVGQSLLPEKFKKQTMWKTFDRIMFSNLALWQKNNWDSMSLVRDYAKERSWEFYPYFRMEAFRGEYPSNWICSDFFAENPEYHCRDREGNQIGRISYAFKNVQDKVLKYFEELISYNPDGLCLCFVRGVPLVAYEQIMLDGFKSEYGLDARELDELDERWLDYQCSIIDSFMRRVKNLFKTGMRIAVIIPGNEIDNRRWGLNPAKWLSEGIVDDLYPVGQAFNQEDVHYDCPENLDFDYFNNLPSRKNIRLIPMLYPWQMFSSDYEKWCSIIQDYLEKGADAHAVWDGMEASRIDRVAYLGSSLEAEEKPAANYIKLKKLNGIRVDRYHYFEVT